MGADRLARIGAAGGGEPAIGADDRAQHQFIGADTAGQDFCRRAHLIASVRTVRSEVWSVAKGSVAVSARQISTSSTPFNGGIAAITSRAASFNRRLARLRATALPIFLVAV